MLSPGFKGVRHLFWDQSDVPTAVQATRPPNLYVLGACSPSDIQFDDLIVTVWRMLSAVHMQAGSLRR